MSVLGVIPARYGSTRFPGKPLADIAGQSLIRRVWNQCSAATQLDDLLVATDDRRIAEHVTEFGGRALMTSPEHASGTDRLGEIAGRMEYDFYVNIQGDEPLIEPAAVDALVQDTLSAGAAMSTIVAPVAPDAPEDHADPNIVKAICDPAGYALYFSRAAVPFDRDLQQRPWWKHIGIYMYSRDALERLCGLERTPLEQRESLEQLRALESGIRIYCVEYEYEAIGVDVPGDVAKVERILESGPGS